MNEIKTCGLKNNLKLFKYVCVLSFVSFLSCLCLQVFVSNSTALKGKDFKAMYDKRSEIEKEIALLKYEDSSLSSLDYVEEKAQSLGFVPFADSLLSIVPPALAVLNTP